MLFHVAFILIRQTFLTIIAWLPLTTSTLQRAFKYFERSDRLHTYLTLVYTFLSHCFWSHYINKMALNRCSIRNICFRVFDVVICFHSFTKCKCKILYIWLCSWFYLLCMFCVHLSVGSENFVFLICVQCSR